MVSNREQTDAVVNTILKNRFALNVVVGQAVDFYHLNSSDIKVHSLVYPIQFLTKSLLFDEIEASLKKEFPDMDFYTYATPIVHIAKHFHDEIKNRVTGLILFDKEEIEN